MLQTGGGAPMLNTHSVENLVGSAGLTEQYKWMHIPRKLCVMLLTLCVMVVLAEVSRWLLLLLPLLFATITRLRDISPFLFILFNKKKTLV